MNKLDPIQEQTEHAESWRSIPYSEKKEVSMTQEMIHAFQRDRKLVLTEKAITYKTVRRLTLETTPFTIDCQERAMEFLSDLFEYRPTEALYAIALNSCNDFIGMILLSNGTVDRATVYPRELVTFLLHETNATGVIIAHNHPGGREEASPQDISLTRHLQEILKPLEIRLLDHLIYSSARPGEKPVWSSLRAKGLI